MVELYSRAYFIIFELNLVPKLKKVKDLKKGWDIQCVNVQTLLIQLSHPKGPLLLARHLGDPSNGVDWNAANPLEIELYCFILLYFILFISCKHFLLFRWKNKVSDHVSENTLYFGLS